MKKKSIKKSPKEKKKYICDVCGKGYKTSRGLEAHARTKHAGRNMITIVENGVINLKPTHELFCQYYIICDETRGNQTQSYALAHGVDLDSMSRENEREEIINRKTGKPEVDAVTGEIETIEKFGTSEYDKAAHVCAELGSRLLRKVEIGARNVQLRNSLLNDKIVDSEMAKVIMIKDPTEPNKMRGIVEYNKLGQRITEKVEHTFGDLKGLSDKELEKKKKGLLAFFNKK